MASYNKLASYTYDNTDHMKKLPRGGNAPKWGLPWSHNMAAKEKLADDEAALRMVFPQLVEELHISDIFDELYQKELLTKEEYKGILDATSKDDPKAVNRRILMAVSCRPPGFVLVLVDVLKKKYSSLSNALENGECGCLHAPEFEFLQ